MKKRNVLLTMAAMTAAAVMTGYGESSSDGPFESKDNINWVVTSSPDGDSDIYTRMILDITVKDSLINGQTIIVTNKTDRSGEIGRNGVAGIKGKKADYILLTFNSGDLMPMVQNTKNRSSNFRILTVMVMNKQLIFEGDRTQYADFSEAIEAAKSGTKVVISGSKGNSIATYNALITGLGIGKGMMIYITYDSTGDAIITALGGYIEFVISKPAVATEYMAAGSLIPVLALSTERYTSNLIDALTLSKIGNYGNVEASIWHGVATPAAMSDSAAASQSEQLKKVSETDAWDTDYLERNKLIGDYMDMTAAIEYVAGYEKSYMESMEIQQEQDPQEGPM